MRHRVLVTFDTNTHKVPHSIKIPTLLFDHTNDAGDQVTSEARVVDQEFIYGSDLEQFEIRDLVSIFKMLFPHGDVKVGENNELILESGLRVIDSDDNPSIPWGDMVCVQA